MDLAGYIASVFIGISLGLIGGGGSILTVPVLVYLFGIEAGLATIYSLFIVGLTSMVGAVSYFRKGFVDTHAVMLFGFPSVIAVFLTRHYLLPVIPDSILSVSSFTLTKNMLFMLLFAVLMLLASYSMIKKDVGVKAGKARPLNYLLIITEGMMVGMVTGLIGAGGGFLLIPALVKLLKLPVKTAVGTSLLIVVINSLTGFLFSLVDTTINWPFLMGISTIAATGILIGTYMASMIDSKKLKRVFGWFVLLMGIYVLVKELILI